MERYLHIKIEKLSYPFLNQIAMYFGYTMWFPTKIMEKNYEEK